MTISNEGRLLVAGLRKGAPFGWRFLFIFALSNLALAGAYGRTFELVTDASAFYGFRGNGGSYEPYITPSGRFVAFISYASNFFPDDYNGVSDIFLLDRHTGELEVITDDLPGAFVRGPRHYPVVSNNGEYVAFFEWTALHGSGNSAHIGLYHRASKTLTNVLNGRVARGGTLSMSGDGTTLAFTSSDWRLTGEGGNENVMLYDIATSQALVASRRPDGESGNSGSWGGRLSRNARWLSFISDASNLVPDDTNGHHDLFVRDNLTGEIRLESVSTEGDQANADIREAWIDGDGSVVAFRTAADFVSPEPISADPAQIFTRDLSARTTSLITGGPDGQSLLDCSGMSLSASGLRLGLACGPNEYLLDTATMNAVLMPDYVGLAPVAADWRWSIFSGYGPFADMADRRQSETYLHDGASGSSYVLSRSSAVYPAAALDGGANPAVADSGAVVFVSHDSTLVPGVGLSDQVLLREDGVVRMLADDGFGLPIYLRTITPAISRDGRHVAFHAWTGSEYQLLVLDRSSQVYTVVWESPAADYLATPRFSPDGNSVLFSSGQDDLVDWDYNNVADIFIYSIDTATTELLSHNEGWISNASSSDPVMSADGREVAFLSGSRVLVGMDVGGVVQPLIKDRGTGAVWLLPFAGEGVPLDEDATSISLSDSGRFVAVTTTARNIPEIPSGATGCEHVYLLDRESGVVVALDPPCGFLTHARARNVQVTPAGDAVFFEHDRHDLVDPDAHIGGFPFRGQVYRYERATGELSYVASRDGVTPSNGGSGDFSITASGWIVFGSSATNLAPGVSRVQSRQIFLAALGDILVPRPEDVFLDGFED